MLHLWYLISLDYGPSSLQWKLYVRNFFPASRLVAGAAHTFRHRAQELVTVMGGYL